MRTLPNILLPVFLFVVAALSPALVSAATTSVTSTNSVNSRIEIHTNGTGTTQINQKITSDNESLSPTLTPSSTPKVTPTSIQSTPTATPTVPQAVSAARLSPRPTVSPTPRPTAIPTQASSTTSDEKKTFIMNAINDYRRSRGLSDVRTSTETCNFAKIRAKEISTGFNHDGFRNRVNNKTIPYAHWTAITENIAMTSNYKNVVNMWINSSGHAANMRKDTPYVCVESYGNYYAYEGMRP